MSHIYASENIKELPLCCQICMMLYGPWHEDFTHKSLFYCRLGMFLPTKKKTCKRQQIFKVLEGEL